MNSIYKILRSALPLIVLLLSACGGGGGNSGSSNGGSATPSYSIGVTVSGLTGTVILQNNGTDNLTISANGNYSFTTRINNGSAYAVTVHTQPAGQTCTVNAGTGTVSGGNVTGIALACVNNTYEIIVGNVASSGGTWSGTNPDIFTPNAPMATVSVTDIQSRLNAGTAVTLTTSPSALGDGNIFVSSTVSWTASTLKLAARRNIIFNTAITGSGTAGLALEYGQGAVAVGNTDSYSIVAPISLANTGSFSTKLGSDGAVTNYTVVTSLGLVGSITGTDLQGINGNLAGNYVLGSDIDATGSGFTSLNTYTGSFDGLGHTVNGLSTSLFANLSGATVRNIGITNVNITGRTGALSTNTYANTTLNNVYATGAITDGGGLIGLAYNGITITDSHTAVTLGRASFSGNIGGLLGYAKGGAVTIRNSYATGNIVGLTFLGGLLGLGEELTGATIQNSHATGNVAATGVFMADNAGGLVGAFNSTGYTTISDSYATGIISGNDHVGGLVGAYIEANGGVIWTGATTRITGTYPSRPEGAIVSNSYATGNVTGNAWVGGLIGGDGDTDTLIVDPTLGQTPITVQNSYAIGNVTGNYYLGGLVGHGNFVVTISGSYATGSVTGTIRPGGFTMSKLGGLLGGAEGAATLTNSHATGAVYGTGQLLGGLAGSVGSGSTISGCYATGNVTGTGMSGLSGISSSIGGLIGAVQNGALTSTISDTYATGNVSGTSISIGGLIGSAGGTLTRSYSSGSVVGGAWDTGSLLGVNGGTVTNSYWNADTSGLPAGVGTNVGTFGAIGKTTAEMKSQATFTGWDFVNKWQIVEGVSYPTLR